MIGLYRMWSQIIIFNLLLSFYNTLHTIVILATCFCKPWRTPFPIWNQSVIPLLVLIVASWPAYRFPRRQVRWSGNPISWRIFQFVMIHTVNGFSIVNKTEVDVFLKFSCFFYYPTDVGNFTSDPYAFSKSSLKICKSLVHILLKPGLENFEHLLW